MAAAALDLSTIGVKFGWAVETTAGTRPTAFTQIKGCKSIGGISLEPDNIETTPLESETKTYVAGLKDTGGQWALTFNLSDNFIEKWNALKAAAATGKAAGKATWAVIYIPNMTKACFVTFEPGDVPLSDIGVSEALEVEVTSVINVYKGWDTSIEPTAPAA